MPTITVIIEPTPENATLREQRRILLLGIAAAEEEIKTLKTALARVDQHLIQLQQERDKKERLFEKAE